MKKYLKRNIFFNCSKITLISATVLLSVITSCDNNIGSNPKNKSDNLKLKYASNELVQNYLLREQKYLKNNQEMPIHLSDGFDSRTGISKGDSCMAGSHDPKSMHISNQRSVIHFTSATDTSTVSSMIGASLSGKADFGVFSSSFNASYSRETNDTRQDMNFTYWQSQNADVSFDVAALGNSALTPDARQILEQGGGLNDFHKVCGDSFIKSAQIGSILLANVAVHFENSSDKTTFQASIKGKALSIGGVSAAIDNMKEQFKGSYRIDVSAMQLGGDTTKFGQVFASHMSDKGNYAITDCAEGDFKRCDEMINDVLTYAARVLPTAVDFAKPDTLHIYSYNEKLYDDLDIKAKLPPLSEDALKAKRYLVNTITHDRLMLEYLQTYSKQTLFFDKISKSYVPGIYAQLNNVNKRMFDKSVEKYQNMIKQYDNFNIIDSCYGDTNEIDTRCVSAAEQVKAMHEDNQDYIDIANNMGDTIVAQSIIDNDDASYSLVPISGSCNSQAECQGLYSLYKDDVYMHMNCWVDTTASNYFFDSEHPEFKGKMYVCNDIVDANKKKTYYVKRTTDGSVKFGILGQYMNDKEQDGPIGLHGNNVRFYYSDSSDFLFNPI